MAVFFTIGYEETDIDCFLELLGQNKIDVLVDVRELPLSRKKGFSKNDLRNALEVNGIDYEHHRDLGSSRELRKKFKEEKSFSFVDFEKQFRASFSARKELLEYYSQLSMSKRICLMCFEKNADCCHRSILSNELIRLSKGESTVTHL